MLVRLVSKTYFNFLDMLSTHKKSISSWPGIVTKHWGHQCLLSWKHLANVQKKKKFIGELGGKAPAHTRSWKL